MLHQGSLSINGNACNIQYIGPVSVITEDSRSYNAVLMLISFFKYLINDKPPLPGDGAGDMEMWASGTQTHGT